MDDTKIITFNENIVMAWLENQKPENSPNLKFENSGGEFSTGSKPEVSNLKLVTKILEKSSLKPLHFSSVIKTVDTSTKLLFFKHSNNTLFPFIACLSNVKKDTLILLDSNAEFLYEFDLDPSQMEGISSKTGIIDAYFTSSGQLISICFDVFAEILYIGDKEKLYNVDILSYLSISPSEALLAWRESNTCNLCVSNIIDGVLGEEVVKVQYDNIDLLDHLDVFSLNPGLNLRGDFIVLGKEYTGNRSDMIHIFYYSYSNQSLEYKFHKIFTNDLYLETDLYIGSSPSITGDQALFIGNVAYQDLKITSNTIILKPAVMFRV